MRGVKRLLQVKIRNTSQEDRVDRTMSSWALRQHSSFDGHRCRNQDVQRVRGGVTFPSLRGQRRDVQGGQGSVIGLDGRQRDLRKHRNDLHRLRITSTKAAFQTKGFMCNGGAITGHDELKEWFWAISLTPSFRLSGPKMSTTIRGRVPHRRALVELQPLNSVETTPQTNVAVVEKNTCVHKDLQFRAATMSQLGERRIHR